MTRMPVRLLLGAFLSVALVLGYPSSADADSYPSPCPAMTDSITRLYNGYFGRDPDRQGFDHWINVYRSGAMSLDEISESLARSPEFSSRNLVGNEAFVNWMYTTVLGREPTSNEFEARVQTLDNGYPRGSLMLTLTESYEYVLATNTVTPLAGYLKVYPKGTHWYCSTGSATVNVNDLVNDVWADYYFYNRSGSDDPISLWTLYGDQSRAVNMNPGTLPSGYSNYNWHGVFRGDGDYGRLIEVQAGNQTDWIVVFYPHSIGVDRLGWELPS